MCSGPGDHPTPKGICLVGVPLQGDLGSTERFGDEAKQIQLKTESERPENDENNEGSGFRV